MELTKEQKLVLEFYKYLGARWLATDKDGREHFYEDEPKRVDDKWEACNVCWRNIMQSNDDKNKLGLSTWADEPLDIDCLLRGIDVNYWRKLPIDTKVEVYNTPLEDWVQRHYAGFEDGKIYCFSRGESSWTNTGGKIKVKIDEIRVCE